MSGFGTHESDQRVNAKVREFALHQLEEGIIRPGEILLQPGWDVDYSALVREYVATLDGPSPPAADEGSATEDRHRENGSSIPPATPDRPRRVAPVRDKLLASDQPRASISEAISSPGHFFAALRDERPTKAGWVRDESVAWGTILYNTHTAHTMTLNATAALIWEYCDGRHDVASIAAELREVFPCAPDTESDLVGVLHKLMYAGMIIDGAAPLVIQDKRGHLIRRALRVVSRQKWVKTPVVRKMSGAARGAFRQRG